MADPACCTLHVARSDGRQSARKRGLPRQGVMHLTMQCNSNAWRAEGRSDDFWGVVNVKAKRPRHDARPHSDLQPALRDCVTNAVRRYLTDIGSCPIEGMHALVICEVEQPLLREVLEWSGGNQSRAAEALGINRATLRKKLQQYGLVD